MSQGRLNRFVRTPCYIDNECLGRVRSWPLLGALLGRRLLEIAMVASRA